MANRSQRRSFVNSGIIWLLWDSYLTTVVRASWNSRKLKRLVKRGPLRKPEQLSLFLCSALTFHALERERERKQTKNYDLESAFLFRPFWSNFSDHRDGWLLPVPLDGLSFASVAMYIDKKDVKTRTRSLSLLSNLFSWNENYNCE